MTLKQYGFDSGTQGTTITTGNTGAALINLGAGTGIFDSGVAAHGGLGIKLTSGAGNLCTAEFAAAAANTQMAASFVVQLPAANDTNSLQVIQFRDAVGNRLLGININGSGQVNPGRMVVTDAGNTNNTLCSAGGFTFGAKYRFEFVLTSGSTTASSINVKMFDESTGTQVGNTVTSATANLTTAAIYGAIFGIINTNNSAGVVVGVDDVQFNDGATTAPSPMTDTPPLTGSLTDNLAKIAISGGTAPYTISPTTGVVDLDASSWLVPKDPSVSVDYTITDATSQTTVITVPSYSAANLPLKPVWAGVPGTNWA